MTDKLYFKEDITDWRDEAMRKESFVTNEDDVITMLNQGMTVPEIARITVASQEMGLTGDKRVTRPNRVIIQIGASSDIYSKIAGKKRVVETESGAKYSVREYIGFVPEKADGNTEGTEDEPESREAEHYVTIDNAAETLDRDHKYLTKYVTGHIWERLLRIYECGGDVRNEADQLKAIIDEMVSRLV